MSESDQTYLLRAEEIEQLPGLDKQHFLNANARRNNRSLGDLTGLDAIGIHLIEVAPGCQSTELHVHHDEEEAVYVLAGQATAVIGEERLAIGPGDFIGYRKGGLAHSLHNTGKETLRCLVIGQRLSHDMADYPDLGKRLFRRQGQPWNLVDHDAIVEPGGSVGSK